MVLRFWNDIRWTICPAQDKLSCGIDLSNLDCLVQFSDSRKLVDFVFGEIGLLCLPVSSEIS